MVSFGCLVVKRADGVRFELKHYIIITTLYIIPISCHHT